MENNDSIELQSNSKRAHIVVDLANLPTDHFLRKKISYYHPSDRDNIRIAYLQKRSCQPFDHNFSQTQFGKTWRHFN
jgi:myo-inositol catabolism protein IolC